MTEAEIQGHHRRRLLDPGGDEKTAHLLKIAVPLLATIANSWGAKIRLKDQMLDPWEHHKKGNDEAAAAERVAMFARMMGLPLTGMNDGK